MRFRAFGCMLLFAAGAWVLAGCPPDGEPLFIVTTSPGNGQIDVGRDAAIQITFDRAGKPGTVDAEVLPEIAWAEQWSNGDRTVSLAHAASLAANTWYTVHVYDVRAADGGTLDQEYEFSFRTGAEGEGEGEGERDYREDMRGFVQDIAAYARMADADFIVVPQNGEALLTLNGTASGTPSNAYIAAIDGQGREDLFYGFEQDNVPTPAVERDAMLALLDLAENQGVEVLVTDYCSTHTYVDNSYAWNASHGFISFAANRRDLDAVPSYPAVPYNAHTGNVAALGEARNFLYVLDPGAFASRAAYLSALANTNFDLFIIDLFFDETALTPQELAQLKAKAGGGARLVLCYMSIGEAEDYRYYWQSGWTVGNPAWLEAENPDWAGNYKVRYWDPGWQAIIYGDPGAYLDRILAAGFDGVYLDIIDAYEYFESQ